MNRSLRPIAMKRIKVIERVAGGGTVFLLPFADLSEAELLAGAGLAPQDEERYARFPTGSVQRRKEWLATRVLVREKLGGGRIDYDSSGRPLLSISRAGETVVPISISHTTGWAALMATNGNERCGVDVELVTRDATRTIARIASAEELNRATELFSTNPPLLVWCAKEAAYKAIGSVGMDFRTQILLTDTIDKHKLSVSVPTAKITLEFFETNGLLVVCGSH